MTTSGGLNTFFLYIKTIPGLGFRNVLYVIWYRVTLKTGIRSLFFPRRDLPGSSAFFETGSIRPGYPDEWMKQLITDADRIISGQLRYYSYHWKKTGNPPDWFLNPFSGRNYPGSKSHWTKLPDFNAQTGDIKKIWEASRFEWAVTLARAYSVSGEIKYIETLNSWLKNWSLNNPLNTGPNWKCGQEASIRVINLVIASAIIKPTESLADLVYAHLGRINGNILYAISQDNNHGTSEAAGLFIGGRFLELIDSKKYQNSNRYSTTGRKWLENRIKKLISADGSFSQHSVNYHRVLVDTITFAEYFRKKNGSEPFSFLYYERSRSALNWLFQLTDEISGHAPNLGANDGSLLNHLHQTSYSDYRSSLQLASTVFRKKMFFDSGPWDESLWWLEEMDKSNEISLPLKKSSVLKSGYVVLRNNGSWALLRFPHFRFRPSHNDVFHFDLWSRGRNVLCDAGSFSYNPDGNSTAVNFKSVGMHNTVSFDGHEQMPSLSRFLMGNWIKPDEKGKIETDTCGCISWKGSYIDSFGNKHSRKISVSDNTWTVEDTLSGKFITAEIGFNINTLECTLNKTKLTTPFGIIDCPEKSDPILKETLISEYYNEIRPVQRLIFRVNKPGVYTTVIQLDH